MYYHLPTVTMSENSEFNQNKGLGLKIRETNRVYLMSVPTPNNVNKRDYPPYSSALSLNHFSVYKMNAQPIKTKLSLRMKDFPPMRMFRSMCRNVPLNVKGCLIIIRINSLSS